MTNPEQLPGLHERRVEAIAQVRCGDSFVGDYRARRIIAADPATALLAECGEVIKIVCYGLDARIMHAPTNRVPVFEGLALMRDLLSRLGGGS